MTALTTGALRQVRNRGTKNDFNAVVATGSVIYEGSMCVRNLTNGRVHALPAATISVTFTGMSESAVTGVTDGSVKAKLSDGYEVLLATGTDFFGDEQTNCALTDDNTVDTAAGAGTSSLQILVGTITERASATTAWVRLGIRAVAS